MRRVLLGLVFGVLLAVPATLVAAPPKATNVVTPMTQTLDANGWNIENAQAVSASNIAAAGLITSGQQGYDGTLQFSTPTLGHGPGVIAGDGDPSLGNETSMPRGSIYLRSTGELWLKTGPDPCGTCWVKVAP